MADRPPTRGRDEGPDRDAELRALLAERSRVPPAHVQRWVGVHQRVRVMRRRRVATRTALSAGLVVAMAVGAPLVAGTLLTEPPGRQVAAPGPLDPTHAPADGAPADATPAVEGAPSVPHTEADRRNRAVPYRPAKIYPFDLLPGPGTGELAVRGTVLATVTARQVGATGTTTIDLTMPQRLSLTVQSTGTGRVRVALDGRAVADFRFRGGEAAGYDTLSPFDADLRAAGVTVGRRVTVTVRASGYRQPAWRVVLLDGIKR